MKKRQPKSDARSARPKSQPLAAGGAATLKELLNADTVAKLQAEAERLKEEQRARQEEQRLRREQALREEQERLDNDFEHLLSSSRLDWKAFK